MIYDFHRINHLPWGWGNHKDKELSPAITPTPRGNVIEIKKAMMSRKYKPARVRAFRQA